MLDLRSVTLLNRTINCSTGMLQLALDDLVACIVPAPKKGFIKGVDDG